MKRFLTILLTTLALAGLLCVTASAANFDGPAEELAAIGMLKGGAGGFDLDKAPTRAQAAIMLVRLFGAEEEAQAAYAAGDLRCPFADVNDTAAPSVAWLVDKGLANGASGTSFGASDPCTGKAYTIFLLRALGYKDGEDFTSANAQEFAMTVGLLDTSVFTGTFLRDDLVALTYQALGADLKDGGTYLLASLIKSGAVDAAAAKPITEKIEAYRALQASGAAAAQGLDTSVEAKVGMNMNLKSSDGSLDMEEKADAEVKGRIQMVLDQDLQMAMDMTVTVSDGETAESEKMEYWLKDGVAYVRSGEDAYQMPMDMGMDVETICAMMEQATGKTYATMLPFIDSITTKTSGGDTLYTLKLNDAFAGMINGLTGQILGLLEAGADLDMEMSFSLDGSTITYTVGKDGALKSAVADLTLKAGVKASDGKDSLTASVSADLDMTMEVKAMGKDMKISFPDFSDFEDVIGGADGPTGIFATAIY
ncbi:MAG: hypothetical protein HFG05_05580 [Oscillibacter sp.]|nr:hypothetical protein [Oscillibacter sp.]